MIALTGTRKAGVGAVCALILTCAAVPAASARQQDSGDTTAKKPASTKAASKPATTQASAKHSSRKHKPVRARGQQKIDSERATAIQEALIREHYLSGSASGTWNQSSEDAMRRYQADHGWQTKEVPDSRALIKLGLGPSKDHLLNPESAMTTGPDAPRASALPTTSHSAPTTSTPASSSSQTDSTSPQ
jgi:hypothetical protein